MKVVVTPDPPKPLAVTPNYLYKLNYDFEEYFNLELLDGYGITETSTMVTMNWSGKERNMGSCGLPLPGMSVRIIDGNDLDVKPGEEGELICRGPNVMIGYHKKENETDKILKNGWYLSLIHI